MLSVPNRTTWENFFKQEVLRNCDIRIYGWGYLIGEYNYQLVATKSNVKSFSLSYKNSYVCNEYPVLECEFVILDYKNLSENVQKRLQSAIRVSFVIEGVETGYLELSAKDFYIPRNGREAKFTKEVKQEGWNYFHQTIWDNGTRNDNKITVPACPINLTKGMAQQLLNLRFCKGAPIRVGGGEYSTSNNLKDFQPTVADGNFDFKNVHTDYDIQEENDGKDEINVYGFLQGTETTLWTVTTQQSGIEPTKAGFQLSSADLDDYSNPVYITRYVVKRGSSTITTNSTTLDQYNYYIQGGAPYNGTLPKFTIYGYEAVYYDPSKYTQGNTPYIQTYAVIHGSQGEADAQAYCRSYFSNKKIISFDCRIDPTIEPLDIINMDTEEGNVNIAVEEVNINYSGGYTGSIKGRIVNEITSLSSPTCSININQSNFNAGQSDSYSITITNSNALEVVLKIKDYSRNVVYTTTVPANSTITLLSTTDMNDMFDDIVKYRNTDLDCWFERVSLKSSTTTILVEVDEVIAPIVTIDTQHAEIGFRNTNPMAVELVAWWSEFDRAYRKEIKAGETLWVSPDEYSPVYDEDFADGDGGYAYYDYISSDLYDPYWCMFVNYNDYESADVMAFDPTPKAPVISDYSESYPTFSFKLNNYGDFTVTAYFYEGSTYLFSISVQGDSYQLITDGMSGNLDGAFSYYSHGDLQNDVKIEFESDAGYVSSSVVLWRRDG